MKNPLPKSDRAAVWRRARREVKLSLDSAAPAGKGCPTMTDRHPFILLDDARASGAADALLFEKPRETFVARRPDEVEGVLAQADAARRDGGELAGYIAYEAGLALEPKLAALAEARSGGAGPLVARPVRRADANSSHRRSGG